MNKSRLIGAFCATVFTFITTSSQAALTSVLGGQAAYDDVLDITWLTDADLSGLGTWQDQLDWIADLNTANHLGFSDWRLASMSVVGGLPTGSTATPISCVSPTTELACRDNELGYMYYHNLTPSGDTPPTDSSTNLQGDQTVAGTTVDVTFTDIGQFYWSGTEYTTISGTAWNFGFGTGLMGTPGVSGATSYGWAVRPGNVPVPAAVWLFGSGLLGLIGVARRQRS